MSCWQRRKWSTTGTGTTTICTLVPAAAAALAVLLILGLFPGSVEGIRCYQCRDKSAPGAHKEGQGRNWSSSSYDSSSSPSGEAEGFLPRFSDFSCSELMRSKRKWLARECSSPLMNTCAKIIVFNGGQDGFGQKRDVVSRFCQISRPGDRVAPNFCDSGERKGPVSPGLEGEFCVCNKDLCNGGPRRRQIPCRPPFILILIAVGAQKFAQN